ncbi:MAG: flagellin, partial [Firmicutes bacterium]|nr:flagellin [Bacillota bacterium]
MDAESLGVRGEVYTAQPSGITGLDIQSLTGEAVTIKVVASQETNNPEVAETTASFEDGTITITLAQAAGNDSAAGAITAKLADVKAALESVAGDAGIVVIEGTGFNGNSEATSVTTTLTNWEIDEDASAKVGINVSSQAAADKAITVIDDAIVLVSAERSKLGAHQNRLEHTIANLGTSAENLQAAESRIRDLDMAEEIMAFTK